MLKDPYDYIEWNPDLNNRLPVALDYSREKHSQRKHIGEVRTRWIKHVYDMIVLCTLATVVAILLKLLLN